MGSVGNEFSAFKGPEESFSSDFTAFAFPEISSEDLTVELLTPDPSAPLSDRVTPIDLKQLGAAETAEQHAELQKAYDAGRVVFINAKQNVLIADVKLPAIYKKAIEAGIVRTETASGEKTLLSRSISIEVDSAKYARISAQFAILRAILDNQKPIEKVDGKKKSSSLKRHSFTPAPSIRNEVKHLNGKKDEKDPNVLSLRAFAARIWAAVPKSEAARQEEARRELKQDQDLKNDLLKREVSRAARGLGATAKPDPTSYKFEPPHGKNPLEGQDQALNKQEKHQEGLQKPPTFNSEFPDSPSQAA